MNIVWSCFPKFFKSYSLEQLAALAAEVGLDTLNVVVREGYAVAPDTLAEDLPRYLSRMRGLGLDTRFATTGFHPKHLLADESILAAFGDNGIQEVRLGYYGIDPSVPLPDQIDRARRQLAETAEQCARHGVRVVYQVHHGTLFQSASAVYAVVRDLPPDRVGVMLDPGNQWMEGWENWSYAARLLGKHLVALGVKDAGMTRDGDPEAEDKGWNRGTWVPLPEGVVNWYEVIRALNAVGFDGTFVYMPFYHEDDPAAMTRELKREVAYLRRVVEAVEAEEN